MTREERNKYTDDYFPDDWGDEDIAFLAKFARDEFHADLVRLLDGERDYDYALYVSEDEEE